MQEPVQIELHGFEPTVTLRRMIEAKLAELEHRFERIAHGRVVVRALNAHPATGDLYEIAICLSFRDGQQVVAKRTPSADERYCDLEYAINDTFHRLHRQLEQGAPANGRSVAIVAPAEKVNGIALLRKPRKGRIRLRPRSAENS